MKSRLWQDIYPFRNGYWNGAKSCIQLVQYYNIMLVRAMLSPLIRSNFYIHEYQRIRPEDYRWLGVFDWMCSPCSVNRVLYCTQSLMGYTTKWSFKARDTILVSQQRKILVARRSRKHNIRSRKCTCTHNMTSVIVATYCRLDVLVSCCFLRFFTPHFNGSRDSVAKSVSKGDHLFLVRQPHRRPLFDLF